MTRKPKTLAVATPVLPSWLPDPNDSESRAFGYSSAATNPYTSTELELVRTGSGEPIEVLLAALKDPELIVDFPLGEDSVKLKGNGWRLILAAIHEIRKRSMDPELHDKLEVLKHEIKERREQLEAIDAKLPREMRRRW